MALVLPLQSELSAQPEGETAFRTISVQYGNGYEQRAKDGINSSKTTWGVTWAAITLAQYTTVVAALEAAGGVDYFLWKAPGDTTTKKWKVLSYIRGHSDGEWYYVNASLEQVYDLT